MLKAETRCLMIRASRSHGPCPFRVPRAASSPPASACPCRRAGQDADLKMRIARALAGPGCKQEPAASYFGESRWLPCCASESRWRLAVPPRQDIQLDCRGDYSPASSRSFFRVGLCLSCLSFRFLLAGSARVGGGVPIAWRAAALTAEAARNGFGLRILDGIAD